jgi:hypothetical protein
MSRPHSRRAKAGAAAQAHVTTYSYILDKPADGEASAEPDGKNRCQIEWH